MSTPFERGYSDFMNGIRMQSNDPEYRKGYLAAMSGVNDEMEAFHGELRQINGEDIL